MWPGHTTFLSSALKTSGSTEPLAQNSACHEMARVLSLHLGRPMDVCSQKAQSDSNSACSTSNSRLKAGGDMATSVMSAKDKGGLSFYPLLCLSPISYAPSHNEIVSKPHGHACHRLICP